MSARGEPREPAWTDDEIRFLRENYIRVSITDIAIELGRSYEAVRRKASKVGVQRQGWGEKFTPEEDRILLERYVTSPMSEMVALLKRHHNSIRARARTLGLVNEEQVKRAKIAAGIRHDYFSQIDGPLKAYLLGLLAADGCVSSTDNSIKLKVSAKDVVLVELLRDAISPHSVVRVDTLEPLPGYTKKRKAAAMSVSSAQMKADLGQLGIVPRKTFTIQWPRLAPQFTAPFILGCFDGDGMLRWSGQPWQWRWCLYSASESFLTDAHEAIHRHLGLDLKQAVSVRGLHELRLNGGKTIQVLDAWLHADVPGLNRKRLPSGAYDHAQQVILAERAERARKRTLAYRAPEKVKDVQRLRAQGATLDQIAAETGVNKNAVWNWINNRRLA
jgi:hypothetical protein